LHDLSTILLNELRIGNTVTGDENDYRSNQLANLSIENGRIHIKVEDGIIPKQCGRLDRRVLEQG
jgi:hypothetical protein